MAYAEVRIVSKTAGILAELVQMDGTSRTGCSLEYVRLQVATVLPGDAQPIFVSCVCVIQVTRRGVAVQLIKA